MQYLEIPVITGVLQITHVASKCFYLVQSINIHDAAIMANGQLKLGTYQSQPLQDLYNLDPELDYTYVSTATIEDARKVKHDIMAKHYGGDLLLNQQDFPKIQGIISLTHSSGVVYWGSTSDIVKQHRYQYVLLNTNKHKSPRLQELYNEDPKSLEFGFEIFQDMDLARKQVSKRMDDAAANGLSANKGLAARQHQGPGVYILTFPNGEFYIGSSKGVANRLSWHKSALTNNTHSNPVMQCMYNAGDTSYKVQVDPYPTKEEAREAEQVLITAAQHNTQCLNLATDVKGPGSYLWTNPEYRKKLVAATRRNKNKPEAKEKYSASMKAYWANPEAKEARTGGNNPFAKKLSVDGIVYGAFNSALTELGLSRFLLKKRIDDPNDTTAFYL